MHKKCNTRSRTQQNIVNCIKYLFKAQPEDGSIETSRNMLLWNMKWSIYCNSNCLFESCVRLYILCIYIYIYIYIYCCSLHTTVMSHVKIINTSQGYIHKCEKLKKKYYIVAKLLLYNNIESTNPTLRLHTKNTSSHRRRIYTQNSNGIDLQKNSTTCPKHQSALFLTTHFFLFCCL